MKTTSEARREERLSLSNIGEMCSVHRRVDGVNRSDGALVSIDITIVSLARMRTLIQGTKIPIFASKPVLMSAPVPAISHVMLFIIAPSRTRG